MAFQPDGRKKSILELHHHHHFQLQFGLKSGTDSSKRIETNGDTSKAYFFPLSTLSGKNITKSTQLISTGSGFLQPSLFCQALKFMMKAVNARTHAGKRVAIELSLSRTLPPRVFSIGQARQGMSVCYYG